MLGGADAEDAAQTAFLRAYERLDSFREDAEFSSWIYRIAANAAMDILRRRGRDKTVSMEALPEELKPAWNRAMAKKDSALEDAERRRLLESLLSTLPPDYRLVLTLRELEGLSYEEIAKTLDWTLDSVKARLRRARVKIAETVRHFPAAESV